VILDDNHPRRSLQYMQHYGYTLAALHGIKRACKRVKHRKFFDLPDSDYCRKHLLSDAETFLRKYKPKNQSECFVHGDFHYANILWKNNRISAVLDFELSGLGIREFDLAWAVFLRPGQRFLDTLEEIDAFLQGYAQLQKYSPCAFWYYYVLIAARFFAVGDAAYQEKVRGLIAAGIGRYMSSIAK